MRLPDVDITLNPSLFSKNVNIKNFKILQKGEDSKYARPAIHKSKIKFLNENHLLKAINQNSVGTLPGNQQFYE